MDIAEREYFFWLKIDRNGPVSNYSRDLGPCWIWKGCSQQGYGATSWFGKNISAYKLAYCLFRGPVPHGFELDHLCRVRRCCCPWHLEIVTHSINGKRSWRAIKPTCLYGHPYSGSNLFVNKHGHRFCRTCRAGAERARRNVKLFKETAICCDSLPT